MILLFETFEPTGGAVDPIQATDQCTPEACVCANSRTHVKYNASTVDGSMEPEREQIDFFFCGFCFVCFLEWGLKIWLLNVSVFESS